MSMIRHERNSRSLWRRATRSAGFRRGITTYQFVRPRMASGRTPVYDGATALRWPSWAEQDRGSRDMRVPTDVSPAAYVPLVTESVVAF